MLALAKWLTNMSFNLEIWPHVPPDFHYPSTFQLLVNWEAGKLEEFVKYRVFTTFFF